MFTKLVNDKQNDWDEHLGVVLFAYRTAYKFSIGCTSFQLLYGMYLLMPIKYLVSTNKQDDTTIIDQVQVLTNKTLELEKLEENMLEAINNVGE